MKLHSSNYQQWQLKEVLSFFNFVHEQDLYLSTRGKFMNKNCMYCGFLNKIRLHVKMYAPKNWWDEIWDTTKICEAWNYRKRKNISSLGVIGNFSNYTLRNWNLGKYDSSVGDEYSCSENDYCGYIVGNNCMEKLLKGWKHGNTRKQTNLISSMKKFARKTEQF